MAYAAFAGIPERGLPQAGWPWRGIPGAEAAAAAPAAPAPAVAAARPVRMDEGNYYILGPRSSRIRILSPELTLGVTRTSDDEALAVLMTEL